MSTSHTENRRFLVVPTTIHDHLSVADLGLPINAKNDVNNETPETPASVISNDILSTIADKEEVVDTFLMELGNGYRNKTVSEESNINSSTHKAVESIGIVKKKCITIRMLNKLSHCQATCQILTVIADFSIFTSKS